mgnify:CR=1 FL=1
MTFIYPAVLTPHKENEGYHVTFPDLVGCEADGPDLQDAVENARAAAYDWVCVELEEDDPDMPEDLYVWQECGTAVAVDLVDSTQRQWAYVRWIRTGEDNADHFTAKLLTLDSSGRFLLASTKAAALREKNAAAAAQSAGAFTVIAEDGTPDEAVEALIRQRADAKKAKNFAEADRIRDELKAQGIEVTDVPNGAKWKRI